MKKRINHPSQRRATLAMDKEGKPLGPLNKLSIGYLLATFHVDPSDDAKRAHYKRMSGRPPKHLRPVTKEGGLKPRS